MKHLFATIIVGAILALSSAAQVETPDFAYPATVQTNAETALATARKSGNAVAELRALMELTISRSLIDEASEAESYRQILTAANRQKDPQMKALFRLFAVRVLNSIYQQNRRNYDKRQLPTSPRPADMSEWSGEMFRIVADSLNTESWAEAGSMPLEEVSDVITADSLTLQYIPTLSDFAMLCISNNPLTGADLIKRITVENLNAQAADSAPYYYFSGKNISESTDNRAERNRQLIELFESAANKSDALVLWQFVDIPSRITNSAEYEQIYQSAVNTISIAENTWAANILHNIIALIERPKVYVSSLSTPTSGMPFDIQLRNINNISKLTLKFYRFDTYADYLNSTFNGSRSRNVTVTKPVETISYNVDIQHTNISAADSTITAVLPAGYYALRAYKGSEKLEGSNDFAVNNVRLGCYSTSDNNYIGVFDAVSGKACPGAVINIIGRQIENNTVSKGEFCFTSNKQGYATIPNNIYGDIQVSWSGLTSNIPGISLRTVDLTNEGNNVSVQLTTGLGVYQPSDTVRWMALATKATCVADGCNLKIKFSGRNMPEQSYTGTTDSYGRLSGYFVIPGDVQTGTYSLRANIIDSLTQKETWGGSCSIPVSDFKVSQAHFDNIVTLPRYNNTDSIRLCGRVITYAGSAVCGASVTAKTAGADSISQISTLTDDEGNFELKWRLKKRSAETIVLDSACSTELTALCPDGSTITGTASFSQYYSDRMSVVLTSPMGSEYVNNWIPLNSSLPICVQFTNPKGENIDVAYKVKILNEEGSPATEQQFGISGENSLSLEGLTTGNYTICIQASDSLRAAPQTFPITIFDPESGAMPDNFVKVLSKEASTTEGADKTTLCILAESDGAWINVAYIDTKGNARFASQFVESGMHNITIKIPDLNAINKRLKISSFSKGRSYTQSIKVSQAEAPKLSLQIETFRNKTISGSTESWTIRSVDNKGRGTEAALAVNVYDTRLNRFGTPHSLNIIATNYLNKAILNANYVGSLGANFKTYFYKNLKVAITEQVTEPLWMFNDTFGQTKSVNLLATSRNAIFSDSATGISQSSKLRTADAATYTAAVVEEESDMLESGIVQETEASANSTFGEVILRQDEQYNALWMPVAQTNSSGIAVINCNIPNSNTTWHLHATAWTRELNSASIDSTFISSKAVTATLNAPRFVRYGDEVLILATIYNNTADKADIAVKFTADSPKGQIADNTTNITINPESSQVATIKVKVRAEQFETGDSLTLTVRAINGIYSDGEQCRIPVLESQTRVNNADNFYLNPGDTIWRYNLDRRQGTDFAARLEYTDNPMWTVVEALKVLTSNEAGSTANSQASVYFCSALALGLMEEHPELELQFDCATLRSTMQTAIRQLQNLQMEDGGWCWGIWARRSSIRVTEEVLNHIATLKRMGYLGDDSDLHGMITKAVNYLDIAVSDTDLSYSKLRPAFSNIANTANGIKVLEATLQSIMNGWKKYDITSKAEAATILWYNGRQNMARTLLSSLNQFGTQSASKGFEFKNVKSLNAYAYLLEAYGTIDPESKYIDGLRQYLIIRKQAQDWGNSAVTSNVVQSMITSGTPWTIAAGEPTVSVDGQAVTITPLGKTGAFTVAIDGASVVVERTDKPTTPAYGAIVTSFTSAMSEVEAYSDGEIYVDKKQYVSRSGSWHEVNAGDTLYVGERVKVQITLKTERAMSRVQVTDQRPAAFEPVVQLSSWIWADGVSAYRENRNSVTNLYIENLSSGTHILDYEMFVNNAGSYSSGIATATCSTAPTLTAHSSGISFTVDSRN